MELFQFMASDGHPVQCYSWVPAAPKAIIQISHGMGEHAARYDWLGELLAAEGYAVYANDHRGHGKTAGSDIGYMGVDGWNRLLADAYELNQYYRSLHPGLALCLLGHSMGSMMAQQYITKHGHSIDALVLSGSPGFKETKFGFIPRWISLFEQWRHGREKISDLMQQQVFGTANTAFDTPGATGYEWLSRDAKEVQKYIDDEGCGFVLATGSLIELSAGSAIAQSAAGILKIPVSLPIYVFSGAEDPVHGGQEDLYRMVGVYRRHGMQTLDCKLYPGGRHEMFNEINKEEVVQDLVDWLKKNFTENTKEA